MRFGSLFAGIGGLDLGLERAGMSVRRGKSKCDEYARRVLAKHWPDVRRWRDVRTFPPEPASAWSVDLVCGGFPCQDISNAGKRAGIDGARSGLWSEYARIIDVVRPRYVLVENVAALLGRGMGRVLGDLSELGYDAEWDCLPAAAFGALHVRNRVFLLAYAKELHGDGRDIHRGSNSQGAHAVPESRISPVQGDVPDTNEERRSGCPAERRRKSPALESVVNMRMYPAPKSKSRAVSVHRLPVANRQTVQRT